MKEKNQLELSKTTSLTSKSFILLFIPSDVIDNISQLSIGLL